MLTHNQVRTHITQVIRDVIVFNIYISDDLGIVCTFLIVV
jgi:hypothetical protein